MSFQWPRPPRVYGILDTGYTTPENRLAKCRALIAGGADIIQLRAKDQSQSATREILRQLLPLFADVATPLVLNDDWQLALEFPQVGVHVGQDDDPVAVVRDALGPDRILGLSTHSPEQAAGAIAQAGLLDYFAVGPVFATPTKPDYTPVGLELVRHVAGLKPALPWFCIGGVKRDNASQVIEAGAQALVAVSDLLLADDTVSATRTLRTAFPG